MLHEKITEDIIRAFYRVYRVLGYGFLEKVYENAMVIELRKACLKIEPQKCVTVHYGSERVGEYFADLLVEDLVIVELKAANAIAEEHESQLINYLKATGMEVGLLLNFGRKPEFKRKIFETKKGSIIVRPNAADSEKQGNFIPVASPSNSHPR